MYMKKNIYPFYGKGMKTSGSPDAKLFMTTTRWLTKINLSSIQVLMNVQAHPVNVLEIMTLQSKGPA